MAMPATASSASAGKSADWTQLVVDRLDMEYAEEIIEVVCAMGDSDLGFRGTGGPADHQVAQYIADEMDEIGLDDVDKEIVPVDAWEFRSAYLQVEGMEQMVAASFGGFPGTDDQATEEPESIYDRIVWVGNGYESDYVGKNVKGAIVLVNWVGYDFWSDSIAYAAWDHEAAGIVLTTVDCNVGQGEDAISCHDGLYVTGWPPLISISKEDATEILEKMDTLAPGEELMATMYSDIVKTPQELGGFGYNVVGYLPGKYYGTSKDEFIIFGPHHDAWFQGAMDDTSAIASMLVIAKAMVEVVNEENWKPERTVIFTSHTAEEYGIDDTYFDWCWGAYYQINVVHKDEWVGRTVAYLCMELMGMAGEPIYINCVPELYGYVRQVLASNRDNIPYGAQVDDKVHTWADHWTFAAAGIPSLEFETVSTEWETYYYHTQCDAPEIIDYEYLEQLFRVISDLTVRLMTAPTVPYNFDMLSNDLSSHLNGMDQWGVGNLFGIYDDYGVDSTANLERLLNEAELFEGKVVELKTAVAGAKKNTQSTVNSALMSIAETLDTSLIAMGVWEQDWYPYQQPINDVYHIYDGIQSLKDTTGGDFVGNALGLLNWAGIIWYYDYMSYGNYMDQRDRLTGDRQASWGLQTHLQPSVEIWAEYDALAKLKASGEVSFEDVEWIILSLEQKLVEVSIAQLEDAFELMWTALSDANGQIDQLVQSL